MRKNIVAGNWKMNNNYQEGMDLAFEISKLVNALPSRNADVILGVPYMLLNDVSSVANAEGIAVASQNVAAWEKGAYTGEVSAIMIKSTGAEYVILGHSERRKYFGEDEAVLRDKIALSLQNELKPIYCCGEVKEEREAGNHFEVVEKQINEGLFNLSAEDFSKVVIAYEPVWAIGTGLTASPEQAQEMHAHIRKLLAGKYGEEAAENTTLLYGGSCNAGNAKELFANPDVDGGLIGGASLKAEDFIQIITAF